MTALSLARSMHCFDLMEENYLRSLFVMAAGRSNMSKRKMVAFAIIGLALMSYFVTVYQLLAGSGACIPWRPLSGCRPRMPEIRVTSKVPVTHIYFLKTHKCASTTVQRIFMSYAIRNNLSVALPLKEENIFFPKAFQPEIAKRTCSHPNYDVVAAHTRFHLSARAYMPDDTLFVSIVRDPAEQMESTFYYFFPKYCNRSRFANITFESHVRFLNQSSPRSAPPPLVYPCGIDNMQFLQLFDFGLDLDPPPTKGLVQTKIAELDSDFHLVLVVERLDEGLIILRDMLGWSTEDMLYLKSNFRLNPTNNLSTEVRAAAYAWNWGDKMLYDHFRSKMDAMIEHQAEYLHAEVRKFRERQAVFYSSCVASAASVTGCGKANTGTSVLTSYELNEQGQADERCRLAAISELGLFALMNKMYPNCNQTISPTAVPKSVARYSAKASVVGVSYSGL